MNRNVALLCILALLMYGCGRNNSIQKELNCESRLPRDVQWESDLEKTFTIPLPKHWKVNLYQDEIQSSIYAADTTLPLSKSILIDISHIQKNITFDKRFKLQNERTQLANQLVKIESKEISSDDFQGHYERYSGVRNNLAFASIHLYFTKTFTDFLHIKIAVYGKENVEERICKATAIIDQIKFHSK